MKRKYIMPKSEVEHSECFTLIAVSSESWKKYDEGAGENGSLSKEHNAFYDDSDWNDD
jgi:hypothetical protein